MYNSILHLADPVIDACITLAVVIFHSHAGMSEECGMHQKCALKSAAELPAVPERQPQGITTRLSHGLETIPRFTKNYIT